MAWLGKQDWGEFQSGKGDEHHLPHLYSQVGGRVTVSLQMEEEVVMVVDAVVKVVVGGSEAVVARVVEVMEVVEVVVVELRT